ncbi:hypothetical protein LJC45_02515 [Alistipes sp. OttesenSCG-928-B03]|nr:hypothetical protein [Alistipes sp. OttesenSCG-928-B03]
MDNTRQMVFNYMSDDIYGIRDMMHEMIRDSHDGWIDTHDFIRQYMQYNQREYVKWLAVKVLDTTASDPFKRVHGYIGEFLSENRDELQIDGKGKVRSLNIFGSKSPAEKWVKA